MTEDSDSDIDRLRKHGKIVVKSMLKDVNHQQDLYAPLIMELFNGLTKRYKKFKNISGLLYIPISKRHCKNLYYNNKYVLCKYNNSYILFYLNGLDIYVYIEAISATMSFRFLNKYEQPFLELYYLRFLCDDERHIICQEIDRYPQLLSKSLTQYFKSHMTFRKLLSCFSDMIFRNMSHTLQNRLMIGTTMVANKRIVVNTGEAWDYYNSIISNKYLDNKFKERVKTCLLPIITHYERSTQP